MGKNSKNYAKLDERSNVLYFNKLLKKSKVSARSNVAREMNLMLGFLLSKLNADVSSIVTNYAKKEQTIRPKLVQSAFQTMLVGNLRTEACESGANTLLSFMNSSSKKAKAEDGGENNTE